MLFPNLHLLNSQQTHNQGFFFDSDFVKVQLLDQYNRNVSTVDLKCYTFRLFLKIFDFYIVFIFNADVHAIAILTYDFSNK